MVAALPAPALSPDPSQHVKGHGFCSVVLDAWLPPGALGGAVPWWGSVPPPLGCAQEVV